MPDGAVGAVALIFCLQLFENSLFGVALAIVVQVSLGAKGKQPVSKYT